MTETVQQAPGPIDLEQFERLVYGKRYEDALGELIKMINGVKLGAAFQWSGNQPSVEALFTRVASAITALFADREFALTYDGFVALAANHPTFHSLFRVSAFRDTDYLLNLIGKRSATDPARVEFSGAAEVPKFLLCWSLESSVDFAFDELATTMPEYVSAALVGILGIGGIHTKKAYERKCELLKKAALIEAVPAHESMVVPMCDVYMHCSYVDVPWKHEIKKVLNRQFRRLIEQKMAEHNLSFEERFTLTPKDRPTIVIPVEWFGSHHAMYRCYAPSIRQLREHFRVVCIARETDVDEVSEKEFDKCVRMQPEKSSIFDLVQTVQAENPDIIFYPSIGMAGWWVALSTFRLAPLQIMCPGHPATTHSPMVDYIVSDGDLFGDESLYSEKCVSLPVGTTRYINSAHIDRSKFVRPDDGIVRIAIPAMAMKLVPPFLEAVKQIHDRASVPCEFHFFPNMIAMFEHLITTDLRAWVPNAIIHPRMTYADYMQALSKCDLMLSSFPFCGTNSVIDAFLVGMPVVALEGSQIHERSGASMIRRIGQGNDFIAHSVEEYVEAALYLITDGVDRRFTQEFLKGIDVEAEFYGDGPEHVLGMFGQIFLEIYQRKLDEQKRAVSEQSRIASIGDRQRDAGYAP